ncbi:YggS family pyridoxal phosphate-dependent enzyme [Ferruginibacter sp. HRS2-29]|uniref:YggS family pyridoxal phosphate-dependent enzyme n=1 Tax=Ferruginibacter sp. HRS2-29 TaxID=2487334 RepID=UPI0020CB6E33|nr:YggS family pyridoxal phosphate-dependent enzyme [Ferruginibacter sp. HRS2-29]MCP9749857.1 YggS family pyridoxal phosphate-dependent enzyme [Ferruginibacter sp. HRS2-29]
MAVNITAYKEIVNELTAKNVTLVAVSKFKSAEDIMQLYELGQRDFGENFVQELLLKQEALPKDIRWHFIGHLQSNKVKYIAPFIHLIHGVDSKKLLAEINKQAAKLDKQIHCLLQVYIAEEETKFGFDLHELGELHELHELSNIKIQGLMGMASFSNDELKIKKEFSNLKNAFDRANQLSTFNHQLSTLSMGMSGDYKIAVECGSTMVRIGSLLFGSRNQPVQ